MDLNFIIKTAASAVAIALLVALAAWAKISKPAPPLDAAQVRALCAVEFPGAAVERVWLAADGAGAIAKSHDLALLIFRAGDGYVTRSVAWAEAVNGPVTAGKLTLTMQDIGAPKARFAVGDAAPWPPVAGAAA
jgi:hypothetical protein